MSWNRSGATRIDETGSDWDSYDPQFADQPGINDLELVSTRDIVWIRVTENARTFQGQRPSSQAGTW